MNRLLIAILLCLIIIPSIASAQVVTSGQKSIGMKDLKITFLNQDPDPVEPGDEVEVRFRAENMGQYRIEDIVFEIITEYPFELLTLDDAERNLGSLDASQRGKDSAIFSWKMRVDSDAIEDAANEIELRYSVEGQPAAIKLEPFQINVKSRDIILAIDEIEAYPEKVGPGQEITLSFPIRNLADSDIDDVRIKLDLEGFPFATVGSTDEQVIRMLNRREVQKVNFTLVANTDAELKTHNIPISISFTDMQEAKHEIQGKFGVQVYEKPDYRVTLADIEVDNQEVFLPNTKGRVIVAFSNTGRGNINALNIKLLQSDEYTIITKDELYIGDLESDDYETAEFDIYVKKVTGEIPLKLELSYKDSENTKLTDNVKLVLNVYSKAEAAKLGLIKTGSPVGIIIIILIIAGIAYWYYRAKKKRQKKK